MLEINAILGISSGIETMAHESWKWKKQGNHIVIDGLPSSTHVAIYDVQGSLLGQTTSQQGTAILPIPPTNQILLMKVGGVTVKLR